MRVNQDLAICAPRVLLVPYDAHHVGRYHEWMQDEALREATASDLLSLDEEYENQQSWRTAHDKLTFIVCRPASTTAVDGRGAHDCASRIYACEDDAPARMVGDVNLFLTPDDDGDGESEGDGRQGPQGDGRQGPQGDVKGEIDIMIATPEHRRQGLGEAAVRAFLRFLAGNVNAVLSEYSRGASSSPPPSTKKGSVGIAAATSPAERNATLKRLVAKIHADNVGSIRLFENLGFRRDGKPDYFNEISFVLSGFPSAFLGAVEGAGVSEEKIDDGEYQECFYDRSRLAE